MQMGLVVFEISTYFPLLPLNSHSVTLSQKKAEIIKKKKIVKYK